MAISEVEEERFPRKHQPEKCMAKTVFESLDFVRLENRCLGIVLPCGKVVTLEQVDGHWTCFVMVDTTSYGPLTLVEENELPPQLLPAFIFARSVLRQETEAK